MNGDVCQLQAFFTNLYNLVLQAVCVYKNNARKGLSVKIFKNEKKLQTL